MSPATHRVGGDPHRAVIHSHLDVRPLLLQQSCWRCCLLWLGNLSKLIVVAIVDVPVALVRRVEALLLVVGGGVGRQLGVVEGGHVPIALLLLVLLVGVVHPGLVGHSDPPLLVLWPCRVFIPARVGGLVERIKRRKQRYEPHRLPLENGYVDAFWTDAPRKCTDIVKAQRTK